MGLLVAAVGFIGRYVAEDLVDRVLQGVAVFTMAKGGLMYEASIGGQKYNFKPLK